MLGIVGWLTVLITGVAVNTLPVVLGVRPRFAAAHIVVGVCLLIGLVAFIVGEAAGPLGFGGVVAIAAGCVLFAIDLCDQALRSRARNPAARAGALCAGVWLIVASEAALLSTAHAALAPVALVAALVGWIGSMVLAHLHHIGVRVIATTVIGEDDETPPWKLTNVALSCATIVAYESAAVCLAVSAARTAAPVELSAAVLGVVATALLAASGAFAFRRARRLASHAA